MSDDRHTGTERPPATARLRAAVAGWATRRPLGWRLGVPVVCALAGLLATTSMINARGTDLRGGRNTDVIGLVSEQRQTVRDLRRNEKALQTQVDALAAQVSGGRLDQVRHQVDRLKPGTGLTPLVGPGLVVTLDDAPLHQPGTEGIDPNLLVVHQQDIQAVVNALWAGGAEGITIQGQRVIATTGIKCVGNTVVLQGVPYSPPYRIAAIGNPTAMYGALNASPDVQTYLQYTAAPYHLGWGLKESSQLRMPAYSGPVDLSFAHEPSAP
jgi:uncharacterized protein YlxW (UPF0749 family)